MEESKTRRRLRLRALTALALAATALATAACGSSDEPSGDAAGGVADGPKPTLTFGLAQSGASLNPARDALGAQVAMRSLAYEALTHLEPDGSIAPGLAESWRYVGEGNRAFELTLRRDARFSDGEPVDAAAVKTWLDYFAKTSPLASVLPLESVEARGEWTVRLNLASANPIVPFLLSEVQNFGDVASPRAVARPATLGTRTFGAGPYVLDPDDTVASDHYTYVPNEHYHDQDAIRFSKVVVKIIPEASSMLQALETGQLDVAFGDASTADRAEAAGFDVVHAPTGTAAVVLMDRGGRLAEPLSDPRVRQALNYAIDREAIAEGLVGRFGTPSSELLTSDGFDPELSEHYPYDPQKAKELLAEAGYADGFTFRLASPAFAGNLGTPVAQAMAKYLDEVGVTMEVDSSGTQSDFFQKVVSGDYPAIELVVDSAPMWIVYSQYLAPRAVANVFGVDEAELTSLRDEAAGAADPAPLWLEMSKRVTEDAIFMPAFHSQRVWFASSRVGGVALSKGSVVPLATEWFPK